MAASILVLGREGKELAFAACRPLPSGNGSQLIGAPAGIRTPNQQIMSLLL